MSAVLAAYRKQNRAAFAWWERWTSSRQGIVLMFTWASAEATVWPIVPDFLLVPMAVGNRRRHAAQLRAAILGMALGGTALYLFAFRAPRQAARMLLHLPTVHERAIVRARAHLRAHGVWAFLYQPWTGVPFKVWAIEGGAQRLHPLLAIPVIIAARTARLVLLATLARLLAERFTGFVRNRFLSLVTIYVTLFFSGWWLLVRPAPDPSK